MLFFRPPDRFWDLEYVLEVVLVPTLLYLLGERGNGKEEVLLRAQAGAQPVQRLRRQRQMRAWTGASLLHKECGGKGICEHGRQRAGCKECGGSSVCEHRRRRERCKDCGGSGICEHGRRRERCK